MWQEEFNESRDKFLLMGVSTWGSIGTVLLSELVFRLWRRKHRRELKPRAGLPEMTVDEIKTAAFDKKQKICVMDNAVLDIKDYDEVHPGGKFVLYRNLGRDITKFFYGAYMLVNDPTEVFWNHSPGATLIANSQVIATIKG